MKVASATWSARDLNVMFEVDDGRGAVSFWELRFTGVIDYLLAAISCCGLQISRGRHPAVRQYVDPPVTLRFGAPPEDADRVVGQLWAAHRRLVDDWIPFDRYLNMKLPLAGLLSSGSGRLATGPGFLLRAYASVLRRHGCRPGERRLRARRPPRRPLLAHFGEAYVVAEALIVRHSPSDAPVKPTSRRSPARRRSAS